MWDIYKKLNIEFFLGKRLLIIGDIGTGKTLLTSLIIRDLIRLGLAKHITIIDMAPARRRGVGGYIDDYLSLEGDIKYLKVKGIKMPRFMGKTKEEILNYAKYNYNIIKEFIERFRANPTKILVINDLSIYLHVGPLEDIIECMRLAKTFIANSYYSINLLDDKGSGISLREKHLVEELIRYCDIVINLSTLK